MFESSLNYASSNGLLNPVSLKGISNTGVPFGIDKSNIVMGLGSQEEEFDKFLSRVGMKRTGPLRAPTPWYLTPVEGVRNAADQISKPGFVQDVVDKIPVVGTVIKKGAEQIKHEEGYGEYEGGKEYKLDKSPSDYIVKGKKKGAISGALRNLGLTGAADFFQTLGLGTKGGNVQAVIFPKGSNPHEEKKFLKKANLSPIKAVHVTKAGTRRYRIEKPSKFSKMRIKKLKGGVKLVMGY